MAARTTTANSTAQTMPITAPTDLRQPNVSSESSPQLLYESHVTAAATHLPLVHPNSASSSQKPGRTLIIEHTSAQRGEVNLLYLRKYLYKKMKQNSQK